MNHGADMLTDRLAMLYKPFVVYAEHRPWKAEAAATLSAVLRDGESGVELWYPFAKRPFETVVAVSSFLPVLFYYLNKVNEWRYVFQRCKVCGKDFLARSRHYELCSDACRKVQAAVAKRQYDKDAKKVQSEQDYETAYYYWYNRQRSLRKGKAANPDKAAAFKVAFDDFRKEALRRKADVKKQKMDKQDFRDWLFQQQIKADHLMEEQYPKLDAAQKPEIDFQNLS